MRDSKPRNNAFARAVSFFNATLKTQENLFVFFQKNAENIVL
ncbi:MAG: hypothetical protein SPE59_02470 [Treponema sp.]|nr:hypothetical protein [Treponema sp.]